jgi:hypothetical protein
MSEELLGDDVANTIGCSTVAGIIPITFEIKTVVEGDFLALRDIPIGHDPQSAFLQDGIAIWRATVIQETGRIPGYIPIEVEFRSERKDIDVIPFAAAQRFALLNALTDVLDHARAFRNGGPGETAGSVDGRRMKRYKAGFTLA